MKYWRVKGEGDNVYDYQFRSKYEVTAFLYSILANIDNEEWELEPMFDIEDDKIDVFSPNGKVYSCHGWHWYENSGEDLMMPDGETFYQKVSKLC